MDVAAMGADCSTRKLLPGAAENSLAPGVCGALGRSGAFGALGGSWDHIGGALSLPRDFLFSIFGFKKLSVWARGDL